MYFELGFQGSSLSFITPGIDSSFDNCGDLDYFQVKKDFNPIIYATWPSIELSIEWTWIYYTVFNYNFSILDIELNYKGKGSK